MTSRSDLPTGTVTFLFTDIEGSTRLVNELGDLFEPLLRRHHDVIREAIEGCGGIDVATEGDSFFVVFTSAEAAVEASVQSQRALEAEEWGDGIEVHVRMGLHTGTGKLVGDNYGGIDVNRAARISSAGHGGQVLLSETTQALVAQQLPDGVRLIDLGRHKLKDLDQPEHLYQLCVDGLRQEFPPPRTKSGTIHNLPGQLTPFIGREVPLREVTELLKTSRLLTLTGPGGTGKTRLSLAVAENAVGEFDDGAFIVFLAPVTDDMLVASTIAQTVGLKESGNVPIETSLKEYLADKTMLLVLDNFEQVVSAAPIVGELMAAAAGLKVLASSRIPLHIAGEQEYAVPPMETPHLGDMPSLDVLSSYEAIDLFVQRARTVQPNFALTDDNAEAVAQICERLDGLPLAIELATARLRLLNPQEMLKRLDKGLALLKSGGRDLPERQQTLRGAIAWSYDLLDGDHKRFFRALGIFSGGFTLEAAETVADPEGDLGFEGVEVMVDNSLVRPRETDLGTTRFRMLQTIREFAAESLEEEGEREAVADRHLDHFLGFLERNSPRFTMDADSLDEAELEHDNIRAALRWAIDSGAAAKAQRIGALVWRFWQARSHLAEGRRWLTEMLELPEPEITIERARAVMALGSITYWQNDFDETRRRYQEALDGFREVGDEAGLQEALYNAGFLGLLERDPTHASPVFEESRALAEKRDDKLGQANASWGLAMAAVQARKLDEAAKWGEQCGALFDTLNDVFGQGLAQFVRFQILRFSGDYDGALKQMRDYVLVSMRDTQEAMSGIELIAEVELQAGNLEKGLRLAGAGAAFRLEYGGGSPLPLVEISDPKDLVKGKLDQATIDRLFDEGYALPRDEAIALALKEE